MTTSDEMANFCYDNYQHPLLWCDEKKRLVERKNAEESMRMWRRRKAEEIARKDKDKQEYYELFLKHCPWGRPGGGAPNVDVRRKDITAVGLHSTPSIGAPPHRLSSLPHCRFSDYFAQRKKSHDPIAAYHHRHQHQHQFHHHHHHVPRITAHSHNLHHISDGAANVGGNSVTICERNLPCAAVDSKNGESLQITLKDHPSMSFRNKGHVDIEVRYKPTAPGKGKPMLEKIVVTETDKCPLVPPPPVAATNSQQKKKLQQKLEKPLSKDPWGKVGPGGKPWRSSKAVGSSFMKSLGWTNKEMLKDLDQDNPVTPAEKHTFRKIRPAKKPERCCEMCTCKCSAMTTSPMKPLPKKPTQQNVLKKDQSTTAEPNKQKVCARFARHCVAENNLATTTDNSAAVGGGVELVPLLARRRAINRPISLSSTDVTKRTTSHDRLSTSVDPRYLHDLNTQISENRRSISITRQLDRDLSSKHFETFDTFWGRPGHGAPSEIKTKLKLDKLLYGVSAFSE